MPNKNQPTTDHDLSYASDSSDIDDDNNKYYQFLAWFNYQKKLSKLKATERVFSFEQLDGDNQMLINKINTNQPQVTETLYCELNNYFQAFITKKPQYASQFNYELKNLMIEWVNDRFEKANQSEQQSANTMQSLALETIDPNNPIAGSSQQDSAQVNDQQILYNLLDQWDSIMNVHTQWMPSMVSEIASEQLTEIYKNASNQLERFLKRDNHR